MCPVKDSVLQETLGTDAEGVWAPDIEQSFQVTESEGFMPPLLTHFLKFYRYLKQCSGSVINCPPNDSKKFPGKRLIFACFFFTYNVKIFLLHF
jgi:hypothetical protein